MPKVSVLLTTYNRPELLPAAISSVLRQTFTDFELIVIDDASDTSDENKEIVASFGDGRIRYFRNEVNINHNASLNVGLGLASGEYVSFLDDDDQYLPRCLEALSEALDKEDKSVALSYGIHRNISHALDKDPTDTVRPIRDGDIYINMLGFDLPAPMSTYMVRASALRGTGGIDTEHKFCEDKILVRKLVVSGYKVRLVPEVILHKLAHRRQKSAGGKERWRKVINVYKEHARIHEREFGDYPSARAVLAIRITKAKMRAKEPLFVLDAFLSVLFVFKSAALLTLRHGPKRALRFLKNPTVTEGTRYILTRDLPR